MTVAAQPALHDASAYPRFPDLPELFDLFKRAFDSSARWRERAIIATLQPLALVVLDYDQNQNQAFST